MAIHSISCHLHFQSYESGQPVVKLSSYEGQKHQDISPETFLAPLRTTKLLQRSTVPGKPSFRFCCRQSATGAG
jgi:hypothetical protein